jgi:hypothetical protein
MTGTRRGIARRRMVGVALLALLALGPTAAEAQGARRGEVRADYDPSLGVRVTSPDGGVQLTAPTGALTESATFSHEALDPPGAVGGSVRLSKAFKLEAEGKDKRSINRFARQLRLVVRYDDAQLAALKVKPSALRLFYQDASSAWRVVPTTVDAAARTLSADVDHFTVFASGTVGVSDSFDRPDSATLLGSATSGQAWRTDGTTWGVCANTACAIGPAGGGNYVRVDSGFAGQNVLVNVAARAPGATGAVGVIANVTADWNTNMLYVGLDPAGTIEVWTLTGGNWSTGAIASQATDKNGTTGRTLEARTTAGSLTVLVDGTVLLGPMAVPGSPADATYAGLFVDTTEPEDRWPQYSGFQAITGG